MKQIETVEDVYPAVEELIGELKASGDEKLSVILHHRMYKVAWTARSELLEELQSVLEEALDSHAVNVPEPLEKQMRRLVQIISGYLKSPA